VRLDASGNKVWEQSFGGSNNDRLYSVEFAADGGFILLSTSSSDTDGNKTSPLFGGNDAWVLKLAPDPFATPPRLRAQMQSLEDIRQNGFRFSLAGVSNQTYVVEHSADLARWTAFQTNQVASAEVEVVDPDAANASQQFYRARTLR
jgi:hypothetical protein